MANYTKTTDFTPKDLLTTGDPDKLVAGTEIDDEFNAIATSLATKVDKVSSSTNDNLAVVKSGASIKDSGIKNEDIWITQTALFKGDANVTLPSNTYVALTWGNASWDDIGLSHSSGNAYITIPETAAYLWQVIAQVKINTDNTQRYLNLRLENGGGDFESDMDFRVQEQAHGSYIDTSNIIATVVSPIFPNTGAAGQWRIRAKQRNNDGVDRETKVATEETFIQVIRWSTQ